MKQDTAEGKTPVNETKYLLFNHSISVIADHHPNISYKLDLPR